VPSAAKRAFKLIVKIFAGLVGILILALGVLLWRLASSPIELDYLTSKVQQVASTLPGGFSLKLKGVELFWNRADRMIDLRAVDVTLIEPSGSSIVTSPEVDISLSVRALMSGVIAMVHFESAGSRTRRSQTSLQGLRPANRTISRKLSAII